MLTLGVILERENPVSKPNKYSIIVYSSSANALLLHTCQVLRKSKSEAVHAPLIFAYNLVIECAEKSGAQILRVRFFPLFKQT